MEPKDAGIDYGNGTTNIDLETGIRFGVISQNEVSQAWSDSSEADYGSPICPKCQREANKPEEFGDSFSDGRPDDYTHEQHEQDEYVCVECKHFFGSESAFGDEPIGFYYDDDGYKAFQHGGDGDIFIEKSPYYTLCQFCSPCAPGAGYITDSNEKGIKAYCFGHDWFENNKAPYPVYSVETNELVNPE